MSLPHVYAVACHTDHVGKGTTFVAVSGTNSNGNNYLGVALDRGATTLVVERNSLVEQSIVDRCERENIVLQRVDNARQALSELSAQAYDFPARKLKIIGITGTKGKTTSVYLLHHILQLAGYRVAMVTGVENKIGSEKYPSELTTPHPDYLHMFFDQCVQQDIEYVVMEASAQAFTLHRLDGIMFDAMIFTNFSLEHSEFYSTIDDYFAAKCMIFDQCKPQAPQVLNSDDPWIKKIIDIKSTTFGFNKCADYVAVLNRADMTGISMNIKYNNEYLELQSSSIVGAYNAENVLGVVVCALELNVIPTVIKQALYSFSHVPGRLERFTLANNVIAVVDYAHNPSSFQALFSVLRQNTFELTVVFGCGGSRDKAKRPIMGELAARYCDRVFITTDNPRSEKVEDIVRDIMLGISSDKLRNVVVEYDRSRAITRAIENAQSGGIVAILGKGPDEYQLSGTTKVFFSDKQEVLKFK